MSYKCRACGATVPAGQPQLKAIVTRQVPRRFPETGYRTEVSAELPVCQKCHRAITEGIPLSKLRPQRKQAVAATYESEPSPPPAVDVKFG